jgi:hypothetical protein
VARRAIFVGAVVVLAIVARWARDHLSGYPDATMSVWPGQVIFGFYFVTLTLAAQTLYNIFAGEKRSLADQGLLMLGLLGLSFDLVLVNVTEVSGKVDASYGIVVLWDAITFFVWLRAVDLCNPEKDRALHTSVAVALAPVLPLGREILFLPYAPGAWRADQDLVFGNAFVALWPLAVVAGTVESGLRRSLRVLVLAGGIYWLFNAVENIVMLVWSPLSDAMTRALRDGGIPPGAVSAAYAVLSLGISLAAARWNVLRLGERFGVAGRVGRVEPQEAVAA